MNNPIETENGKRRALTSAFAVQRFQNWLSREIAAILSEASIEIKKAVVEIDPGSPGLAGSYRAARIEKVIAAANEIMRQAYAEIAKRAKKQLVNFGLSVSEFEKAGIEELLDEALRGVVESSVPRE